MSDSNLQNNYKTSSLGNYKNSPSPYFKESKFKSKWMNMPTEMPYHYKTGLATLGRGMTLHLGDCDNTFVTS